MFIKAGESYCGYEPLDYVIGAQVMLDNIEEPPLHIKVARLKQMMPFLPIEDLSAQTLEVNAKRAFIRADSRPFDFREYIENVQLYGTTGVVGQMFRYLYNEEDPEVDDLGLNIYSPWLVDFDVRSEYGITDFSVQIPVRDILFAQQTARE